MKKFILCLTLAMALVVNPFTYSYAKPELQEDVYTEADVTQMMEAADAYGISLWEKAFELHNKNMLSEASKEQINTMFWNAGQMFKNAYLNQADPLMAAAMLQSAVDIFKELDTVLQHIERGI